MDNFPSPDEDAEISYTGGRENRFFGRKSIKNEQKFVYIVPAFSPFYPKYNVFLRIPRNCVRLDYSSYYARKSPIFP